MTPREDITAIQAEIRRLARERDAVVIAHNYQRAEVQDAASFVGDSLGLSREAAQTDASVIVFAGVHFMAETAKILSPERMVLLPEPGAGCPMANMITAEQARAFKAEHPGLPLVTYVNSSAAVKAETDICCTSANAVEVVRSLGVPKVLFAPDRNLGAWVASQLPEVEIISWDGYCPIHDVVTPKMVIEMVDIHPLAEVLTHPECRPDVNSIADAVLSTSGMLRHVVTSPADEFVVVTEVGLLHGLSKAAPGKRFYNVEPKMLCPNMKLTTLTKVRDCIRDMTGEVTVPDDIRERALASVERMVALG
ncbi:MAG: quinolinate synthase NadA [Actinomycetota bacterium]|nr:MAG: quinolinate [Actinomycetota bacterium]MDO8950194.1 quinolinate synthase NadA [Actinomycetota bacterium]MDP3630035.1 quinolinate synthase NadA [Actinomycetota bacterium]